MIVARAEEDVNDATMLWNGEVLENMDNYTYLGTIFNESENRPSSV